MRLFISLVALLLFPTTALANDHFGELFPQLPPLNSQTSQQLADLASSQLDPNADINNNCQDGATDISQCTGSIETYIGQFLDHDLTLDTSPSPTEPVNPFTLTNSRTFALDLDSVYGGGPSVSPQLYDGDRFILQEPNPNGVRDLPRNEDGSAILVEHRNDENEIISQIHVAFLKLHNHFIDQGDSFEQAQQHVLSLYHSAIATDFLPHILGPYTPGEEAPRLNGGSTPIEFSVAAYRFGHSIVRKAYELTDTTGKLQVFNGTPNDLSGGRQLPAGRQIDWSNFAPELAGPVSVTNGTPDPTAHFNIGRKIDTLISSGLFNLPIPGAEASGSNVLAFRNMIRAKFYDMPSGQEVAQRMGFKPLSDEQLSPLPAGFEDGVPLWYYILREASVYGNGEHLGPVGSQIIGEVFDSLLEGSDITPTRFSDLFVLAGVAESHG